MVVPRFPRWLHAAGSLLLLLAGSVVAQSGMHVVLAPGDAWPDLTPGMTVTLEPGMYEGPWEIDVPGVTVEAEGAVLTGPREGSALLLTAPNVTVRDLRIEDAGTVADLYAPDAAVWLLTCDDCRLEGVSTSGTPAGARIEASQGVVIASSAFRGGPEGPGVTAYEAGDLQLVDVTIDGFLDGAYVERSDGVAIRAATVRGAARYGLHVMFGAVLDVADSVVAGGGVGSAVMYGRDARLEGNTFSGHVGPLAYGLLVHEMENVSARANTLAGNTVGALVVSSRGVNLDGNDVSGSGTGLVVQRTPGEVASVVTMTGNRFAGNVADVAVDDPDAAVTMRGNAFDRATRLDRDGDGVSDVSVLPTSTFAVLQTRQPDVSLFALSPGVRLWEAAEASVPALRLATLHDPAPVILSGEGAWRVSGSGLVLVLVVVGLVVGLVVPAVRAGVPRGTA